MIKCECNDVLSALNYKDKPENKKQYWYGIRGIHLVWHGEWSDPEIEYLRGRRLNVHDIEDYFYELYSEDREEPDLYSDEWDEWDNNFAKYMKDHAREVKEEFNRTWNIKHGKYEYC